MAGLFSPSVTAFKCRYTAVAGLILDSCTGQDLDSNFYGKTSEVIRHIY